MLKRPSEHHLTLEERVAVVVAIAVAVGVHIAIFLGGSGISHFAREEKKRERSMVIRRVREVTPAPELAVRVPDPRRVRVPDEPASESEAAPSPQPEQKVSKQGTLPPKAEITPKMEDDLQESLQKEEEAKPAAQPDGAQKRAEVGNNSVSVVTDLPAASFTISGPTEYRGTGTFWIRRGAPAGTYRIAFSAVAGFSMPPPQTKELPENGQIVFVGKYGRSSEVVVDSNEPGAQFTIYRPDGRPLDLNRPGRALFDDLPSGNYTAVFNEVPGHVTPAPQSRTLAPGGKLAFYGEYKEAPGGRDSKVAEDSAPAGERGSRYGAARGSGGGDGTGGGSWKSPASAASGPRGAALDRRVQLIVTSYPSSRIEDDYVPIPYPGVIIRKSNFQEGWCQVYLIIFTDEGGEIQKVSIERPRPEDRPRYELLIKAVDAAVRSWDYDTVKAEVHVDARFYVE